METRCYAPAGVAPRRPALLAKQILRKVWRTSQMADLRGAVTELNSIGVLPQTERCPRLALGLIVRHVERMLS